MNGSFHCFADEVDATSRPKGWACSCGELTKVRSLLVEAGDVYGRALVFSSVYESCYAGVAEGAQEEIEPASPICRSDGRS